MYYIYKFLNNNNDIIYIGKTNNIYKRMYQHFKGGHLQEDCYLNTVDIQYVEFNNKYDMDIFEIYCINKYKPIYNTVYISDIPTQINIKELNWIKYDSIKENKMINKINSIISILEKRKSNENIVGISINKLVELCGYKPNSHKGELNEQFKNILITLIDKNIINIQQDIDTIKQNDYFEIILINNNEYIKENNIG